MLTTANGPLSGLKYRDGLSIFNRQFFMTLLLSPGHALQHRQAVFQLVDVDLADQLADHRHQQREQIAFRLFAARACLRQMQLWTPRSCRGFTVLVVVVHRHQSGQRLLASFLKIHRSGRLAGGFAVNLKGFVTAEPSGISRVECTSDFTHVQSSEQCFSM
ncbi:hypothetical protein D3C76_743970 [compost metagenome]